MNIHFLHRWFSPAHEGDAGYQVLEIGDIPEGWIKLQRFVDLPCAWAWYTFLKQQRRKCRLISPTELSGQHLGEITVCVPIHEWSDTSVLLLIHRFDLDAPLEIAQPW